MRTWTSGVGIAALMLALATVCGTSEAQTTLAGDWVSVDEALAGKADPVLTGHHLRFKEGRFRITKDDRLLFGGRFETDTGSKPPTITFHQTETPTLNGVWHGIYELDGDSLTICDNAYDMTRPRPKAFDDCSAAGYVILRFTRVK